MIRTIAIEASRPYEVMVGRRILKDIGRLISERLPKAQKAFVVTDTNVGPLYAEGVRESIEGCGLTWEGFVFPAGEESKNASTYVALVQALADGAVTKSDVIIALGGGVVGDIAGFAAATFLRGVPYVQVPTSLLAMVDSSVGGKTAIDLMQGKNLVGAFCQPAFVVCDLESLATLPEAFVIDGAAEILKYAILDDPKLMEHLEENGLAFDRDYVIPACIESKARYVCADEFDNGIRQKLNLGHTYGHGVEKASGYAISHGRAVAIGMETVAKAAVRAGDLKSEDAERIHRAIERLGLPVEADVAVDDVLSAVCGDKKRRGDCISLIVPHGIGDCRIHEMTMDACLAYLSGL